MRPHGIQGVTQHIDADIRSDGVLAQVAPKRLGSRLAVIEAENVAGYVVEAAAAADVRCGVRQELFEHRVTRHRRLVTAENSASTPASMYGV